MPGKELGSHQGWTGHKCIRVTSEGPITLNGPHHFGSGGVFGFVNCKSHLVLQGILVKRKQEANFLEKRALDDSSAYISHTKCCKVDDSSRNLGLSCDSSTHYDIEVRSKKLLFHKGSPLSIIRILLKTIRRM